MGLRIEAASTCDVTPPGRSVSTISLTTEVESTEMSSSRPMKHDTYVAPASALSSAWLAENTSVMLTGWPSATSSRVAWRPAGENGTLTTTCSCSVRSARPSATISAASRETTSAETGPWMSSQIWRIASPGPASSLARSEGLVVAPARTPHAAISSTSRTEPVSMKSLMPVRLLLVSPNPLERVIGRVEVGGHVGRAGQDRPHAQEVDGRRHVVDPDDRGPVVGGMRDGRERAGEAVRGQPSGDRADEVLARDRRQPGPADPLDGAEHRDALGRRLGEVGTGIDDDLRGV